MRKALPLLACLSCLPLVACGQEKISTQQSNQAKQAARYFLSGIQTGNAGWACNNSTSSYWVSADWTARPQASFKQCLQGFKKRFKNNPLDGMDHAQYSRMLAELPKTSPAVKDHQIRIQFHDMPSSQCQSSQMTLEQDGVPWKIREFVQGRCMGLRAG